MSYLESGESRVFRRQFEEGLVVRLCRLHHPFPGLGVQLRDKITLQTTSLFILHRYTIFKHNNFSLCTYKICTKLNYSISQLSPYAPQSNTKFNIYVTLLWKRIYLQRFSTYFINSTWSPKWENLCESTSTFLLLLVSYI